MDGPTEIGALLQNQFANDWIHQHALAVKPSTVKPFESIPTRACIGHALGAAERLEAYDAKDQGTAGLFKMPRFRDTGPKVSTYRISAAKGANIKSN